MNRGKKPMDAKAKKKKDKANRDLTHVSEPEATKPTTTWKILEKFPKRVEKKDKEQLASSEKNVSTKKKKLHSKHSKRTTPGEVENDVPTYDHNSRKPEDKKVIKNIEKQSVAKGRRLSSKISKTKK